MFIYDVGPGARSTYHYEYDEEWLLVVDGTLVLRTPDGEQTLEQADIVCFPGDPHQVINRSVSPARTLMFSSSQTPAVSVYPDTDRICIWPEDDVNELTFRRDRAVPWSPE